MNSNNSILKYIIMIARNIIFIGFQQQVIYMIQRTSERVEAVDTKGLFTQDNFSSRNNVGVSDGQPWIGNVYAADNTNNDDILYTQEI